MSPASDPKNLIRHGALRVDAAHGSLRRAEGDRVALFPLESVHALHASFVETFPEAAADLLYRTGYEWGLQEMVARHQHLRQEIGGAEFDLWQMDAKFILEGWWTPLAEAGWGHCKFQTAAASRGLLLIELYGSIVARALRPAEEPVCHLYAGLFAGAVSFFDRVERHAAELQCSSVKGEVCRFIVGQSADIDAAESWRQQGAAPADILARLR